MLSKITTIFVKSMSVISMSCKLYIKKGVFFSYGKKVNSCLRGDELVMQKKSLSVDFRAMCLIKRHGYLGYRVIQE